MRKVNKSEEPQALTAWRKRNPDKHTYADLTNSECRAIRTRCIEEQKGLCAFCCERISLDASHNAHLLSQRRYPQHSLDHRNIVASCESGENCGKFQGTKELPLTPLMEACETELKFALSGRVSALSERAQKTIDALNLNAPGLCQRRKKAIRDMELEPDFHPVDAICTWDEVGRQ